jgi:hypothetical protein
LSPAALLSARNLRAQVRLEAQVRAKLAHYRAANMRCQGLFTATWSGDQAPHPPPVKHASYYIQRAYKGRAQPRLPGQYEVREAGAKGMCKTAPPSLGPYNIPNHKRIVCHSRSTVRRPSSHFRGRSAMRSDWILFAILGLLWLGAGGIHLKLPSRLRRGSGSADSFSSTNEQ